MNAGCGASTDVRGSRLTPTTAWNSTHANSSRSNRYWLAPDYGYVPVQVEQQNKGEVQWTMKLRSITRN